MFALPYNKLTKISPQIKAKFLLSPSFSIDTHLKKKYGHGVSMCVCHIGPVSVQRSNKRTHKLFVFSFKCIQYTRKKI